MGASWKEALALGVLQMKDGHLFTGLSLVQAQAPVSSGHLLACSGYLFESTGLAL